MNSFDSYVGEGFFRIKAFISLDYLYPTIMIPLLLKCNRFIIIKHTDMFKFQTNEGFMN